MVRFTFTDLQALSHDLGIPAEAIQSMASFHSFKVPQLKGILKYLHLTYPHTQYSLARSGNKEELVQRIAEFTSSELYVQQFSNAQSNSQNNFFDIYPQHSMNGVRQHDSRFQSSSFVGVHFPLPYSPTLHANSMGSFVPQAQSQVQPHQSTVQHYQSLPASLSQQFCPGSSPGYVTTSMPLSSMLVNPHPSLSLGADVGHGIGLPRPPLATMGLTASAAISVDDLLDNSEEDKINKRRKVKVEIDDEAESRTPRTPQEAEALYALVQMNFPRVDALRALRQQDELGHHSGGYYDVDAATMFLVSEMENRAEAQKMDSARVASEALEDAEKEARRKRERQSMQDGQIRLIGNSLLAGDKKSALLETGAVSAPSSNAHTPDFPWTFRQLAEYLDSHRRASQSSQEEVETAVSSTSLLPSSKSRQDISGHLIQDTRRSCMRLLVLEKKAIKWYGGPAWRFFNDIGKRFRESSPPFMNKVSDTILQRYRQTSASAPTIISVAASTSDVKQATNTSEPSDASEHSLMEDEKDRSSSSNGSSSNGSSNPNEGRTSTPTITFYGGICGDRIVTEYAIQAMKSFLDAEASACEAALYAIPSGGSRLPDAFKEFIDDPSGVNLDSDGVEVVSVQAAPKKQDHDGKGSTQDIILIDD